MCGRIPIYVFHRKRDDHLSFVIRFTLKFFFVQPTQYGLRVQEKKMKLYTYNIHRFFKF